MESTHIIDFKMSAYEKELLLDDDCDDTSSGVASHYEVAHYMKPSSRQWWTWTILVQVVLITVYTAVSYAVIRHKAGPESDADIHGKSNYLTLLLMLGLHVFHILKGNSFCGLGCAVHVPPVRQLCQ